MKRPSESVSVETEDVPWMYQETVWLVQFETRSGSLWRTWLWRTPTTQTRLKIVLTLSSLWRSPPSPSILSMKLCYSSSGDVPPCSALSADSRRTVRKPLRTFLLSPSAAVNSPLRRRRRRSLSVPVRLDLCCPAAVLKDSRPTVSLVFSVSPASPRVPTGQGRADAWGGIGLTSGKSKAIGRPFSGAVRRRRRSHSSLVQNGLVFVHRWDSFNSSLLLAPPRSSSLIPNAGVQNESALCVKVNPASVVVVVPPRRDGGWIWFGRLLVNSPLCVVSGAVMLSPENLRKMTKVPLSPLYKLI